MKIKPLDKAVYLSETEFKKLHPNETLPLWFDKLALWGWQPNDDALWKCTLVVPVGEKLKPNQYWKECDGNFTLMEKSADSCEDMCVISNAAAYHITLFEVIVNIETGDSKIIFDTDLSSVKIPLEAWPGHKVKY